MSVFHKTTQEGHAFQRYTLYLLARYIEMPLLKVSYLLLRGKWRRLGGTRAVRWFMSVFIARPFAIYGDSARPVPFDKLMDHVGEVDGAIAVGPCRCRLGHHACDHPIETDIVIRTGTQAWLKAFPRDYRVIDKQQAREIITHCHGRGMFHMIFYHCPSTGCAEYVICNCCECGCVPYIINRDLGQKNFPLFRGEWAAVTDSNRCNGCGDCTRVCPFQARAVVHGKGITGDCFGCGLCAGACPENAIFMRPVQPHSHGHTEDKQL